MPTALIAEDEPLLAAALQAELQQLWPELQIVAVAGNGLRAVEQGLALQPDLMFLDIRMPGLSGLEAAQALAEDWPADGARPLPLLVFVTAYDQYALRAFEQQAVDYLLKPVERRRLDLCLQRLRARLAQRQPGPSTPDEAPGLQQLRQLLQQFAPAAAPQRLDVLQAQIGSTIHLVPVDEVLYFEAADKYVRAVTAEREHLLRLSLRELLPQLDPQCYWQVHRSIVVRIRAVSTATRDESGRLWLQLRQRSERLPVSRLHAHLFRPA